MAKQPTSSASEPSATPAGGWPKIVPSPAVWESGAAASRVGKKARPQYRPRRLAIDPVQRASLW